MALVRRGCTQKRVPVTHSDAIADTVDAVMAGGVEELWLGEREWFVERLGDRFVATERMLVETARKHGCRMLGWTTATAPAETEVYEAVEGAPPSTSPALDRAGE